MPVPASSQPGLRKGCIPDVGRCRREQVLPARSESAPAHFDLPTTKWLPGRTCTGRHGACYGETPSMGHLLSRRRVLASLLLLAGCASEAANGRKWVHALRLQGVQHVDKGDLRDGLATEKTGWWPFARK